MELTSWGEGGGGAQERGAGSRMKRNDLKLSGYSQVALGFQPFSGAPIAPNITRYTACSIWSVET